MQYHGLRHAALERLLAALAPVLSEEACDDALARLRAQALASDDTERAIVDCAIRTLFEIRRPRRAPSLGHSLRLLIQWRIEGDSGTFRDRSSDLSCRSRDSTSNLYVSPS
jgi:hypothetical protein